MVSHENMASFYSFVLEREAIRLRREAGRPQPWTDDKIFQDYKFTNVKRHNDWTSSQLYKHLYSKNRDSDKASIFMMAAFARYFGRFEFVNEIGWQSYDDWTLGGFKLVKDTAEKMIDAGEKVFTGAYVITNQGISAPKYEVVIDHFMTDLHEKIPSLLEIVQMTRSWRKLAEAMSPIKGFGGSGFMTKEILLDTMMTNFWGGTTIVEGDKEFTFPSDYEEWTPIGPGGVRGAARLLGNNTPTPTSLRSDEALTVIEQLCEAQNQYWVSDSKLYPTDIQFQLCEFDKYERVRLGQGRPRSRFSPRKS